MNDSHPPFATLHPTGERPGGDRGCAKRPGLRPALFSAYRDLSKLRYDFPLVLIDGDAGGAVVRSLTSIVDGILQEIAPRGIEGERFRRHLLRLETEIRSLASRGHKGSLRQLWDLAGANLTFAADDAARTSLSDSLDGARNGIRFDGEVVDCDQDLPARLLTHAWTACQQDKSRRFHDRVGALVVKLSDILQADHMHSQQACDAETLKRSVGASYEEVFDFEAMSGILGAASAKGALSDKRRRRIRSVLSALKSQRFFAAAGKPAGRGRRKPPHGFVFDSCGRALEAFRDRIAEMVALVKAMTIAELEIENRYDGAKHDSFFRRFGDTLLGPDDLALFPSYLVCLRDDADVAAGKADLIEILSSGLPIKILAQTDDILAGLSIASGRLSLGKKGSQVAAMALGLDNAFVLQSSSACLYRLSQPMLAGLANGGPALFSVFSGLPGSASASAGNAPDLPPYLRAAAATESRAFPSFTYDPAAGGDWASRFHLDGNAQAQIDWPVHRLCYEDQDLQSGSEDIAFTFVDFAACDKRYVGQFAKVPRSDWHDRMVPVEEFLDLEDDAAAEKVAYILMVDDDDALYRAVVDNSLIDGARRCRDMWRSLQELGGINNSHARDLLAREKETWEQEKAREFEALKGRADQDSEIPAPPDAGDAAAVVRETAPAADAEPAETPSDEPYIETPRCTTCNECTDLNNRVFAYDDNMQAYIADADAATYRVLVEAAEVCQVCIIHPGKPRNPDEPGLDELIARAEPFN